MAMTAWSAKEKLDLIVGEGPGFPAPCIDYADQAGFTKHRHRENAAGTVVLVGWHVGWRKS
jgi:hypothetical protein